MEHQDFKEVTIGRRAGASSAGGGGKAAKDPKAVAAVRDAMRCDALSRCHSSSSSSSSSSSLATTMTMMILMMVILMMMMMMMILMRGRACFVCVYTGVACGYGGAND